MTIGGLLFTAACSSGSDQSAISTPQVVDSATTPLAVEQVPVSTKPNVRRPSLAGNRVYLDETWDTVWTRTGSASDTMLLHPYTLRAIDSTVYVGDYDRRAVFALDAATGSVRWIAGRRGNGPKEFIFPGLYKTHDGRLGVADASNQRLSAINADGTFAREIRVQLPSVVMGVCELGDDVFIAGSQGRNAALLRLSATDDTLHKVNAPWLAYLDEQEIVAGQFRLMQISASWCAVVPILGSLDVLIFDQQLQVVARAQSRELLPEPAVDTQMLAGGVSRRMVSKNAPYSWGEIAVVGESAFIVFEGASSERLRLIDEFSVPDFTYVGTHLAPLPIKSATGSGQALTLLMEDEDGYHRIVQLRRTAVARAPR